MNCFSNSYHPEYLHLYLRLIASIRIPPLQPTSPQYSPGTEGEEGLSPQISELGGGGGS